MMQQADFCFCFRLADIHFCTPEFYNFLSNKKCFALFMNCVQLVHGKETPAFFRTGQTPQLQEKAGFPPSHFSVSCTQIYDI